MPERIHPRTRTDVNRGTPVVVRNARGELNERVATTGLVMGRDLVAVDSTCCRIMGIDPEKVEYLRMAADLGHVHPQRIEQRGETIASVQTNFALIEEFSGLRLV